MIQEDLAKMHGRELLHRYGNVNNYRGVALYRGEYEQVEKAAEELEQYEVEIIKRMERNGTLQPELTPSNN